ncbi:helix-turn-helix domain-containing protein [Qipengyuania flava]|uniref:helix-turn-helix domain-containing protein n=1 Tax=Qipengyuania flava TaxID=192812 RepID=UPI001C56A189|nr:helix-turn-helix transcriptional regulator [Qipengyuania flava]MBW3169415.1 helix-turn-helix domain-containing protein [Qipengyuania flava]MBY5966653.1 helix-turn-helix domain-containing protein [Qipengyuania flava]MBY6012977.1 helix-turn-helix domain-containing protein [Qipengyuania flava]MBY6027419.1 helix-turn-helix domain-containing protein [Qipengyuania flava]
MARKHPDSKTPDALAMSFGLRLAALREKAGLSYGEFAEEVGTSKGYLWKVEQGEILPTIRNAARMARALDVSLSHLMEDVDITQIELASRPYPPRTETKKT